MAFAAYKDRRTNGVFYAFEGEEYRLPCPEAWEDFIMFAQGFWEFCYDKLPPNPSVVVATTVYMTEAPQLDSMGSIYELDRQLNIEAEDDRMALAHQQARRDI